MGLCNFNANDNGLIQNSLDHNLAGLSFVASENAETMDEVFWGTEGQLERMYGSVNHAL